MEAFDSRCDSGPVITDCGLQRTEIVQSAQSELFRHGRAGLLHLVYGSVRRRAILGDPGAIVSYSGEFQEPLLELGFKFDVVDAEQTPCIGVRLDGVLDHELGELIVGPALDGGGPEAPYPPSEAGNDRVLEGGRVAEQLRNGCGPLGGGQFTVEGGWGHGGLGCGVRSNRAVL